MKHIFVLVFVCFLSVVAAGCSGSAVQQGVGTRDDQVNAIAKNLYCPVCANVPLDVCPTAACVQWRQVIADKLEAGWSDQQIYDYFVDQYGDRVLAAPPARGLNWLVYVVPPVALLLGVALLGRVLRSAKTQTKISAASSDPGHKDYEKRIEAELEERR